MTAQLKSMTHENLPAVPPDDVTSGTRAADRAETVLRVVEVRKRYGAVTALDGVSLEVKRGEILGIIGRSGAGKSTLIRCLNGLEKPDSGRIEVLGEDVVPLSEREVRKLRGGIGMVFQHFNLLSSKTVADNVALPLKIAGWPRSERRARVATLLQVVGLEDKADVYPAQLSGGQKQRVGIARALAARPALLLSDEATSALDPETTASILALLRDVNRTLGVTIVLITHEMSVVRTIADRVAVLDDGRIVEQGNAAAVFASPRTALTRRLLASTHHDASPANGDIPDGVVGATATWGPHLDTVFRITLRGEYARRPALADLTAATGARPVILSARTWSTSSATAAAIVFSVRCSTPDAVCGIERHLARTGATVEIIGHVQSAS